MSTKTELQYIVRLEIRATATDPTEAVRDALEKVRRGTLANVAWSVEAIDAGGEITIVPAPHLGSDDNPAASPSEMRPYDVETYHGEFLG